MHCEWPWGSIMVRNDSAIRVLVAEVQAGTNAHCAVNTILK